MLYRKKINELAVTLEKINYLYRTIRKSEQAPKKVELALLKKYVQDLYDGVVDLEMPTTTAEVKSTKETVQEKPILQETPPPVVKEKPVIPTVKEPIPVITVPPSNDTSINNSPLVTLKDQVAGLQDDIANLKANLNDTYHNAVKAVENNDRDATDKTPYKNAADMYDDDESSAKTQILDDKLIYSSGALNLPSSLLAPDDDDDETVALNVKSIPPRKETPALIEVLGKGDANRLEFPISFNQRHAFVKALFLGDEAAYARAINDLSTSKGYIEALTYINLNVRYDFKWRDDEPAVKEFLDIIKHTFWG